MTVSIDKKIVEMAFENGEFEKNVGKSLGTIDKLKQSLNFKGAADSLSGISTAAKNVTLGHIADAVNSISNRFSTMGIVAITTIANITNAAIQAGTRIAKAFTIDPIKAGLEEYELKLNSIQTILANTQKEGTNLEQVTNALNLLNEYSDKTIYNFQQMTRNVGTFTAAGVSLDNSVAAIKGIANLAAISGSNADQASTAMYQLSQALSSGTVKLMDWNSVVNAGMGGQVFQDAIKETARVHGVAIDDMIAQDGSFRETLQRGWFTSEILTETLQKFTGDLNAEQLKTMGYTEEQIASIIKMGQTATDAATKVKTFSQLFNTLKEAAQSGWAQTWEIILGDFDEAKEFFTEANNILGGMLSESADARNAILQGWKDLGGRSQLIDTVHQAFFGLLSILKPIKEAFREIFPPITAQTLFDLTMTLQSLAYRLRISGETADKIKRIFKGVFAALDIGRMAVAAVVKSIFGLTSSLGGPLTSFTDFLARVGDYIVNLRDGLKTTDAFNNAIAAIGKKMEPVLAVVRRFFDAIIEGFQSFKGINLDGLGTFLSNVQIKFEPLKKIAGLGGKLLNLIGAIVEKLAPVALKLGGVVADGVASFVDRIMESLGEFDPARVFEIINGGLLAGVLLAIKKFVSKGAGLFDGITDVLDSVKGSLEAWQTSIKADVLLKIAAAMGILTASILILATIDGKKLGNALGAMTIMFAQLGLSLSAFQKITTSVNPLEMGKMAVGLVAVSTAMLIMSAAMATLGKLDSKQLIKGLLAITTLIAVVKIAANSLSSNAPGMISGAIAMTIFSVAILSLGAAVRSMGKLDVASLTKGLIGVGVLVSELALFMKVTDLSGMGALKAVGILILAGAVNLLAIAVEKMSGIDSDAIAQGLFAMGAIFAELAGFIAISGGAPTLIVTAAGVAIISASMFLLAEVMKKLGDLSWESITKGLVSMGLALTLIGAAAYLIPPTLIVTAAGLVVMAGALVILADALSTMGGMSWDEVARGLVALGGSLLILTIGLTAMSGTIAGSAALLVAAGAVAILAPALKTMGSLELGEIGKALLALAGAFVVLGVAGSLLTPMVPTLLGLGVAMTLLGVGVAALGVGVLAFSAGLAALAVSGTAGAAALVVIITSIVGLVPMLVKQLGLAILALVDVLVAGAPTLLEGVVTMLDILLDGLIKVGPKLITTVLTILDSLLTGLAEKLPDFIVAGTSILINFLKGIRDNIGEVATLAYDIAINFINAVALKLPEIAQSGFNLLIAWIDAVALAAEENIPRLLEAVRGLGLAIVKGVLNGLIEGHADARAAIVELGQILINGFKELLGIHSPSTVFIALAGQIVAGLISGIRTGLSNVRTTATEMANNVVNAVKGKYDSLVSAGRDLVRGFAIGIRDFVGDAVNAARSLAEEVLGAIQSTLGINSPSTKLIEVGMYADQGLAGGITKFGGLVTNSVKNLGEDTITGFSSIISQINDAVNSSMDVNPTIRPVVDLSAIEAGGIAIENLLGSKTLNLSVATVKASNIQAGTTAADTTTNQTGDAAPSSITFNQINNSPKALSRIEIYRQTRNQLSLAKDMVGAK